MIKNQELAAQILEMMNTAIEASDQMSDFLKDGKMPEFQEVSESLYLMMESIRGIADDLKKEEEGITLPAASESVLVSLSRIREMAFQNAARAMHKIEFELIPLIEEMRVVFYYWGIAYPDKERMKKYYEEDIYWLAKNKYQEEALRTGKYKYDVSIVVLAYNKLDYTKQCVVSLLKHFPKSFSSEIILINHGSTDGTKEFFESICPHKQVDIAVNGGGLEMIFRIAEGKYILTISNDVLVQENSLENLYECITSDDSIAWAVPSTPNVSNLQTIPAKYETIEELEEFAKKNNIKDRTKWEQRVRLCNPIDIIRGEFLHKTKPAYLFQSSNRYSFPDDKCALLCRRNGYKMYLVKNGYCHHFGSVTLREDAKTNAAAAFLKGRQDFYKMFEIDPWATGCCYSSYLFLKLHCVGQGEVKVLGINCGIGGNSLKIKEELKVNSPGCLVFLKNITTNRAVLPDLKGISDEAEYLDDYHKIETSMEKFDYIIAEDVVYKLESLFSDLNLLLQICKEKGVVITALTNEEANWVKQNQDFVGQCKKVDFVEESNGRVWLTLCK